MTVHARLAVFLWRHRDGYIAGVATASLVVHLWAG